MNTLKIQAAVGFCLWIFLIFTNQSFYKSNDWHVRIIELASLVWLPLGISILEKKAYIHFSKWLKDSILACALLLIVALEQSENYFDYFALPYLFLTIFIAVNAIENWIFLPKEISNTTLTLAQVLLLVGSSWTIAHCFDFQPFGFDKEIVTLTGVHFHYAGFLLLTFAGILTLYDEHFLSKIACQLLMLSVPLTAIGITTSHYTHYFLLESIAAVCVTLGAVCLVFSQLFSITKQTRNWVKISTFLFSITLLFSMSLAFLYAIRPWYSIDWLTIPYMKAIHGSCNGILVPVFGILICWSKKSDF